MTQKPEVDHVDGTSPIEELTNKSEHRKGLIPKKGVDDALQLAIDSQGETWTNEEERRVLRKIDMVIAPLLFVGSTVTYADSQVFGVAALFWPSRRSETLCGIGALGGVVGLYLLLLPAQLLPAGIVYGLTLLYIGLFAILTIVCTNFSQIMALRFFAGFGSILQPIIIIIAVMWWKTREQPLRLGIIVAGNAIGSLIGNAVDLGALELQGAYAASPWKWIYVILASCTLFVGLVVLFLTPSTPMKAWFLTAKEKRIAVLRLMSNNTGIHTRKLKWRQGLSAFLDPQLYLLCVFSFAFAFSNVAVTSFGTFLVTSFGNSQRRALELYLPASALAAVSIFLAGLIGNRFPNHRIIVAVCFIIPSLAGNIMLWKAPRDNSAVLLAGLYMTTTFYGTLVQHYSLLAANIGGHSKKSVVMGTITIMSALGGFSGPWAYKGSQASRGYPDGQIATLSLFAASILSYVLLWFYYTYCNKKKTELLREQPELAADPMLAFMDLTDRENPAFQYAR